MSNLHTVRTLSSNPVRVQKKWLGEPDLAQPNGSLESARPT